MVVRASLHTSSKLRNIISYFPNLDCDSLKSLDLSYVRGLAQYDGLAEQGTR